MLVYFNFFILLLLSSNIVFLFGMLNLYKPKTNYLWQIAKFMFNELKDIKLNFHYFLPLLQLCGMGTQSNLSDISWRFYVNI